MNRVILTAALLASTWGSAASAAIIYHSVSPQLIADGLVVDLDSDGSAEFRFACHYSSGSITPDHGFWYKDLTGLIPLKPTFSVVGANAWMAYEDALVMPVPLGTPIDSESSFITTWGAMQLPAVLWGVDTAVGGPPATWPASGNAMGVRFEIDSQLHYGWVGIEGARLTGWAYESSPGIRLPAGMVPEPSAVTLALAGIALLRRSRRKPLGSPSISG